MASSKQSVAGLLPAGKKAPDFTLPNEAGKKIKLSDLRGSKVVLYFYPKDHTPGCTQESCEFRDEYSRFRSQNVEIFGISRDTVASHLSFKDKQSLPFSLLSDEDGAVCELYGVWQEKMNYGKKYMGIVRTTYVINEDGIIEKVYPEVRVKDHVATVFNDLSQKGLSS